jgi:hypothetical protein
MELLDQSPRHELQVFTMVGTSVTNVTSLSVICCSLQQYNHWPIIRNGYGFRIKHAVKPTRRGLHYRSLLPVTPCTIKLFCCRLQLLIIHAKPQFPCSMVYAWAQIRIWWCEIRLTVVFINFQFIKYLFLLHLLNSWSIWITHPTIHPFNNPSIHPPSINQSINPSIHISINQSIYLSIYLSIYIYLSIALCPFLDLGRFSVAWYYTIIPTTWHWGDRATLCYLHRVTCENKSITEDFCPPQCLERYRCFSCTFRLRLHLGKCNIYTKTQIHARLSRLYTF